MASLVTLNQKLLGDDLRAATERELGAAAKALDALRDKRCQGSEWTGWFDWPRQRGSDVKRAVKDLAQGLDVYHDLVLVIGIGGSYLGTRAVSDALSHTHAALLDGTAKATRRPPIVYAGHHLSEAGLIETLDLLEEKQPIVNVVSKSGTTTEPALAFRVVRDYLERRYGKAEAARRIIATTDKKKGALRQLAGEAGYKTFEVPDDVGGRFSVLTAVGLVPLALGGFDVEALLGGADAFFGEVRSSTPADHPVLRYAASRHAAFLAGKRIELLAVSEPKLGAVVEWWKQLFGESEGKGGKGLFPAGLTYSTDLHSLGQYVQDGVRNLMETFLVVGEAKSRDHVGVERRLRVPAATGNTDELGYLEQRFVDEVNQAAVVGTALAHADGGVPCQELRLARLDEHHLGTFFAFCETACAVSAGLLGVNAFDQPGVEAYKKNLFGLLGKPGFEQLGAEMRKRL
jgi:glucose-6-phosphate isomerase